MLNLSPFFNIFNYLNLVSTNMHDATPNQFPDPSTTFSAIIEHLRSLYFTPFISTPLPPFSFIPILHLLLCTSPPPSFCHLFFNSWKKDCFFGFTSMASQPEVSETSSLFERLGRNRDMPLFFPFPLIFGVSNASPRRENQDPDEENERSEGTQPQRVILINPFVQGMLIVDGNLSLETVFHELGGNGSKSGPPPASKESIEAMPSVEICEGEDGECVICLEELEVGGVAKEMPCKHRFHPNCIEKWLGIHGSCPVCRYEMPFGEKDEGKGNQDLGERFSVNGDRAEHMIQATSNDSSDSLTRSEGGDGDGDDKTGQENCFRGW